MNKRQAEFVAKVAREFPDMKPEDVAAVCESMILLATENHRLEEARMNRQLTAFETDMADNVIPHNFYMIMFHDFRTECRVEYSTLYCILVVPSGKSDFMGCPGLCIPPNQEEDEG